jgi:hypothetical protein
MADFYQEQDMNVPEGAWSSHSSQRVASLQSLRVRDRSGTARNALGFELR